MLVYAQARPSSQPPTTSLASSASSSDASWVSLAELLRGDLVHRNAGLDVGALRLLGVNARQERDLAAGMISPAFPGPRVSWAPSRRRREFFAKRTLTFLH